MNKRAVAHRMRQLALISFALLFTITLMYRALGLFGTGTIHVSRGTNPFVNPRENMVKVSESMYGEKTATDEVKAQVADLIAIGEGAALAKPAGTPPKGDVGGNSQAPAAQPAPTPSAVEATGGDNAG